MRLFEFENVDQEGYRIPRAKRDANNTCWECGSQKDLEQCGSNAINDPICLSCRKRYGYAPCKKGVCKVNHIKGVCPESSYIKESKQKSTKLSSEYPQILHDEYEIANYIFSLSSSYVDTNFIEEYFYRCYASLQKLPIDSIKEGNKDHNISNPANEKKFLNLSPDTIPPIVVMDGEIEDGNHRYQVAKKKGMKEIWCYVITEK